MSEKIPRLPDAHLKNARELIAANRNKKNVMTAVLSAQTKTIC